MNINEKINKKKEFLKQLQLFAKELNNYVSTQDR